MRFVTVSTVRDDGAAQVAREALEAAGIAVEVRRLGASPYFGAVTASEYEVRVPEERVADGEAVLAQLALELETALVSQAESPDTVAETAADEPRPTRPSALIAAGIAIAGVIFTVLYVLLEGR